MANIVKKVPERKCMGCNEKRPKKELIRVVRTPEGDVVIDLVGKKSGRGAYICKSVSCFEKALKSKRIERCLEVEIPDSVYDEMKMQLCAEVNE
ncbi:MAG: YlxR family protein [Ruminococcaceae bacterium]|nr:YlxR family protein [Oscillospiraceae bacterium]